MVLANVNMISFLLHCLNLYKFTVFVHSVHANSKIHDVVNKFSLLQRTGTTAIRGAAGDAKKPAAAKQDWRTYEQSDLN